MIQSRGESVHRRVADATIQIQSQLSVQCFEVDIQSIIFATLFQQGQVKLILFPAKHLPCHFDMAVGRNVDRRRRRLLSRRQANGPAAEDTPLLDDRAGLRSNHLFFGLTGQTDLFAAHAVTFASAALQK